jgi:hypothetical protein
VSVAASRLTSAMDAPTPTAMPMDREAWSKSLKLSNIINRCYQYRDLETLFECRDVLLVHPAQDGRTHRRSAAVTMTSQGLGAAARSDSSGRLGRGSSRRDVIPCGCTARDLRPYLSEHFMATRFYWSIRWNARQDFVLRFQGFFP